MTMYPRPEENWYRSRRFWTYSARIWDPRWFHKLGVPYFAGDEWGRNTVVWGLGYVGYVVWAYRTCWCQVCHSSREQTYRMEVEEYNELQDKLARGQCTCFNELVAKHWRDKENHPHRHSGLVMDQDCLLCGHPLRVHNRYGDCTCINVSMDSTKIDLPENLEKGADDDHELRLGGESAPDPTQERLVSVDDLEIRPVVHPED